MFASFFARQRKEKEDNLAIENNVLSCLRKDERLHDYDVWVSNVGPPLPDIVNESYKLCYHRNGSTGAGQTDTLHCKELHQGHFVYVSINSTADEMLTVCELEVFPHNKYHSLCN